MFKLGSVRKLTNNEYFTNESRPNPEQLANIFSQLSVQHERGEAIVTALSIVELSEYWTLQSKKEPPKLTLNGRTCLAVVSYVLKFCSDFGPYNILSETIRHLEFAATEYRSTRDDKRRGIIERYISEMFAKSFMPEAEKIFFKVPKLQQQFSNMDNIPMLNEILAGFIHFLLQILNTVPDQLWVFKKQYDPLEKELTFLLTYLGDKPFHCTQLQQVEDILAKFEALANEAGKFVCCCFFAPSPVKVSMVSLGICDLLKKFKLLNANIEEHCLKYAKLPICANPTPESDVIDSLFIVDSLLDDLKNLISNRMASIVAVMDQTSKLHSLLMSARSFLEGIYVPHDTRSEELKECVIQIRDLAYEAEYLINSFVVGNVPSWYLTLRLPNVVKKFHEVIGKTESINMIYDDKASTSAHDSNVSSQYVATETIVVGFEDEKMKILDKLIGGAETLQLISICGMPGLGKTTLASKLFSDRLVTDRFDKLAWCTVSHTYQRTKLLTKLLLTLSSELGENYILRLTDEELSLRIYQTLNKRRYLIVIDDVWDSKVFEDLMRFFPDDTNGSRIMFTSRNIDMMPSASTIYGLPLLSVDQCWELLKKKVFPQEPSLSTEMLEIGKKIARKCAGLPLAVVVVAGILANMRMEEGLWQAEVEEVLPTEYSFKYMDIVLELSYKHLPDHLKLCYLYLGAFPEDAKIPIRKLIWLWIAEGFIQKEKDKSLEQVAEEYLMILINRSLLSITKCRSTGGVKTCTIHDLLRTMCIRIAHKENFMTTIKDHFSVYQKHNRLCILSKPLAYSRPFGLHCRSFLGHLSDPQSSFSQMKLIRILDLPTSANAHYTTEVELKRIDQLFRLRYLAVDRMPETIAMGNLVNLEFLRVDSIEKNYVPSFILKFLKLRHLHLRSEAIFEKDCDTSQTNNLQTFSFVRIVDHKDEDILRCSPHLRKLKCICNERVFPDLVFLAELESLTMKFLGRFKGEKTKVNFPETITKLALSGIGLSWADISIVGKLPNLQVLKLDNYAFLGEKWETKEHEFQELKLLKLNSVYFEKWITFSDHFPKLERLVLRQCSDVEDIPGEIGDIPTLEMIELHECSYGASLSAVRIEKEQRDYGNDDLKVIITNTEWSKEKLVLQLEMSDVPKRGQDKKLDSE